MYIQYIKPNIIYIVHAELKIRKMLWILRCNFTFVHTKSAALLWESFVQDAKNSALVSFVKSMRRKWNVCFHFSHTSDQSELSLFRQAFIEAATDSSISSVSSMLRESVSSTSSGSVSSKLSPVFGRLDREFLYLVYNFPLGLPLFCRAMK